MVGKSKYVVTARGKSGLKYKGSAKLPEDSCPVNHVAYDMVFYMSKPVSKLKLGLAVFLAAYIVSVSST